MLLLAAGHIKFIQSIQLQYSSFLSAKIIHKHIDTYYSNICHASARPPASQSTAPHFPSSLDGMRN